jgi:hypothetical protein
MRRVVIVLMTALASCLWLGAAGSQWGRHTQERVSPPSQREYPQYPKKTQKQGTYSPSQRKTPKATYSNPKITKKEFSQNYKYTGTTVPKGWENLLGGPDLAAKALRMSLEKFLTTYRLTYIPVRVTVTDYFIESLSNNTYPTFFELQGSAVGKGWLKIEKDLTGFELRADTSKYGEVPAMKRPPSIKFTKVNGWYTDHRKRRVPMKFDQSKLDGALCFIWSSNGKHPISLRFPTPYLIEGEGGPRTNPIVGTGLGPYGINQLVSTIHHNLTLLTDFTVTPAMMKKFVDQGYFTKTFSHSKRFEEAGTSYYVKENITIKIEFLKMGKPTVIVQPTPVPKKEKEEEEKWEVFLTGYEIDEMNQYWKATTRVRGAVRFDWKLRGKFTIVKKKGVRTYAGGVITIADVGLSSLYEPISVWLTKPFKCRGCQDVKSLNGKYLRGIVAGNTVRFYWGSKAPHVTVEAKIVVPCKPMPDCARWKKRRFASETFIYRVNYVSIPLVDGATVPGKVVDHQGLRWVNYRYLLRRLK